MCSALPRPERSNSFSGLSGQTAIVTGGGSGIGQGVALGLAAEGAHVVITGRRMEALHATVDQAAGLPGSVEAFAADIGEWDQSALIEHVVDKHKRLDILVNNAGMNIPKRALKELSVADWHRVIDTNLNGAFHVVHAALPQMRLQQDGLIIQITSISGKRTISTLAGAAYCASKFAQQSLGNAINLEEYENGIRCTNIAPGEVATAILDARPNPPSQELREQMLNPADIAAAVVMVAKLPK
jgi:NADP-dependent 3-hydroxy acid dehydrogenase YdfG